MENSSDEEQTWNRVGALVNDRMRQMGLSQADLGRRSGISVFTIRRLQHGVSASYRAANLAKICLALDWTSDSIQRIIDGGKPIEVAGRVPPTDEVGIHTILARLAAMEDRLAMVEERVTRYER